MDSAEVMDAYNIYSPALDGFLEKMPSIIKKLKKQIYQYMVKYEQVPDEKEFSSIWKFVKFLLSFDKGATANRKTIASLLVTIGEQGTQSTFKCECLKDPTTLQTCQERGSSSVASEASVPVPVLLTRSDIAKAQDIENESDVWIKGVLLSTWPEIFN
jgi:hypothetical protein